MEKKKYKIIAAMLAFAFMFMPACLAEDAASTEAAGAGQPQKAAVISGDPLKEKISIDYKDVDIADILRSLSYTYGLNLVTSSEVKGKITISLKDVTIAEALDAILSANGYNYSHKGSILYITPGGTEGAQVVTEPITLKYIKAADAQNLVRKVLSSKGDIKVDEISNMLVVTDYSVNIEKLKELLKGVDQPPRQVLIEAKIVDISSKDLQNLGVTWQIDYSPGHGIFGRSTAKAEELKMTQTLAGPSSSLTGGQLKLDTLVLKGLTANATIDALVQAQKAHLLASPSIAVLNNREARIIIGEKVPYKERTQTTTGTTETTRFIDVGTTLRVTPSINADGYITLAIHPEVSSVKALIDAGPQITTREADTVVRVKEGETIVIGGLIRQEDNRVRSHIPILGDIPIIGHLFSNYSKDQTQTELAVFITPKILLSRAEMLAENKTRYEEEAYVNILSTADLNVQMKLLEKANNLQSGIGPESADKEAWQRKNQALSLYECIMTQFPDGPKAAEASYKAAALYNDLGEYYLAKEACAKLSSKYPNSEFAAKSIELQKSINSRLKNEARQKAQTELAKIKTLEAEEERKQLREDSDELPASRLEEERLRRAKERQEAQLDLDEILKKAREEGKMIKEYRAEELRRQKAEERKKASAEASAQARIKGELRRRAEQSQRQKEELIRQAEDIRSAKDELRRASAEVRFEKDALRRAAAEARLIKEQERKKYAAEEAARKDEERKQARRAKSAQEEAERAAKEKARAEKEAQAKAIEKTRRQKEEQRRRAEEVKAAKEELLREAQSARLAKEEMRKAAIEARRAKEEMRKEAQAAAAAKKEEARRAAVEAAQQARLKEEARRAAQSEKLSRQRSAAEEAARKVEERKKAAEARKIKEEMRRMASAEEAARKAEALKRASEARARKEEARKAAQERTRLDKLSRQKAASEARAVKEEARKMAIAEAAQQARMRLEEEEVIQ